MTTTAALQVRWQQAMMPNYGTPPVALDRGQGVYVWDVDGRRYLDFIAGIAVSSLGHAHPAIVDAVTHQVGRIAHTSNLFLHEPGIALAERLLGLLDVPGRVFFANSGAEANECALKLTRLHGRKLDPSGARVEVVATDGGFHGRTTGALSLTGTPAKRTPFEPLPGPVRFVPFGDEAALRAAVSAQTAALFLETTQGEGGVVPAPAGYLALARRLCDDSGALLVIDEVQSGIGRTGDWFASQALGVRADVITLAKGLGGGLPIGVCIGLGAAGELFQPGLHGSTFGGNPVSAAAALAVLDTIEKDDLLASVRAVGAHLSDALGAVDSPLIHSVRGTGLWQGIVLAQPVAADVEAAARARGLLVNAVKPDVLRLAPPLIATTADVDAAVDIVAEALAEVRRRD
jgi:acetylornithine/N-succinyldiaminopimelate aminotransferase